MAKIIVMTVIFAAVAACFAQMIYYMCEGNKALTASIENGSKRLYRRFEKADGLYHDMMYAILTLLFISIGVFIFL